ncbi:hypothetical protein HOD29_05885 [archaeon]|jgi:hypothetical protein|nr:hypothetical protein [archaeon]
MNFMSIIQTKGFDLLGEKDKDYFDKLLNEYSVKIKRKLKNADTFVVCLKGYKMEGKKKKFSVQVRVADSYNVFEANASDWDFRRTLHKVFNKLETEVEHRFHVSDQHKR